MSNLRVIWGPVWEVDLRVDSEVILRSFWDHIWTLSEKPHRNLMNCLHTAVGRALRLELS